MTRAAGVDGLWRDLTHAAGSLRRSPGYSLCAILMLSLAIGSATAVFSVLNAAWLRPLPHLDADRWAFLYERPENEGLTRLSASIPNYRDWKSQSRSFAAMALWMPWSYNLSGASGDPERVDASVVTPDVFGALGLVPAAGRLLQASDESVPFGPDRPVMISYGLWQRRFGGDPGIAGRDIELNLVPHRVVGVAPRDFSFPPGSRIDVWTPQSAQAIASDASRDARGMQVAGLLRPGVGWDEAQAEMDVIARRLAAQYRENEGFGVEVVPMRESLMGPFRTPLVALFAALASVLLLVSVNIANLQLVKLESRRRELAIRTALGASRGRLVRQAFVESLLLALASGALGLALAPACVRLLLAQVPSQHIPWPSVPIDDTVLLVALGITLAATLVTGLLPAVRAVRFEAASTLGRGDWSGTAASASRRLRQSFVVGQIAVSFVLVVGAALLIQSLLRLQRVDPGFQAESRLTLSYSAPRARYADATKLADLADRIRTEIAGAPGVLAAGAAQALPFAESTMWFQALTRSDPRGVLNLAALPHVHYNVVTPGYAEALGIPLRKGRAFGPHDVAGAPPVVIVNQALAERFFEGEDPIGRQLWVGHAQALPESQPRTIVGVVGDSRWSSLDTPGGPEAWVPLPQQAVGDSVFRTLFVVVHTQGDPSTHVASVRARVRSVDKDLALTSIRTLETRLDEAVWRQRLGAAALGALGLAALTIALLGVFGVTNYLVGRRAREMGVRMAVGAGSREIVRLVMAESGVLVATGVALGVAGSLAVGRLGSSLLYDITSSDATTLIAAALGLGVASLLASYAPAGRAARVDPLVTLRQD